MAIAPELSYDEAVAQVPQRVARGAALLDRVNPGWYQRIDVNELDLSDCNDCVLGQLYGLFSTGVVVLNLYLADAMQHGFDSTRTLGDWHLLRRAWVAEIRMRLVSDDLTRLDRVEEPEGELVGA